jgi:fructose transport system substrate-binding protein
MLAFAMILAACGGDDESADTTAASGDSSGTTAAASSGDETVGVSLILKNTSNPFFVSMANSAEAEATDLNVSLTVAAGQEDGDTQSQIDAIEAAVARGDAGILITPSGDAVVPALDAAREAGLYTIALDTPPNPADAVDITFATDNQEAGELIGQWAAGQLAGEKAVIAMLDLFNDSVVSVDYFRDQGFLIGMGIIDSVDTSGNGNEPATGSYNGGEYEIVCHEPTNGAVDGGKTAMETCLAANPDVNVVYTINEPAAQGAYDALTAAGKGEGVLIVSVDGGCDPGLRLVSEGVIGATAQQYPGRMATLGMEAIANLARGGAAPEVTEGLDFFNTGVALVTDSAVDGVDSISVEEGQAICWG